MTISTRSARRGAAVLTSGLLLGVVPGLVAGEAAHAAPPKQATAISLTASPVSPVYGQKFTLIARLGVANKRVVFSERVAGSTTHQIDISDNITDAGGNLAIVGLVAYNASYTATFAGDAAYGSSSATTSVKVRAKIATKTTGGKKKSGFRLYKVNKKAKFTATISPSKVGAKVKFRAQKLVKGKWKNLGTRSKAVTRGSKAVLVFTGKTHRTTYRVRVEYGGDRLNAANTGAWSVIVYK